LRAGSVGFAGPVGLRGRRKPPRADEPGGFHLKRQSALRLALTAIPLILCTAPAWSAPTQAQQQAIRSSCQSDYRSYCASVPTGGSAALQCLEQNVDKLSSACQQAVRAATGGSGSSSTSTGSTAGTAPATPATPAAPATSSTSPAAGSAPALKPGQEMAIMRQACGSDYRSYCAGVVIEGGSALGCLLQHAASLSATCKGELRKLGQQF
jgi:hypothetical protein